MTATTLSRSDAEEQANVISHGFGAIVAVLGTVALGVVTFSGGDPYRIISCLVYGASLMAVFVSSTLYHAARHPIWRWRMMMFDYSAIYLLIAGSYTPFALVTLRSGPGWWLLAAMWGFAMLGIALRLFGPRNWPLFSTALYVIMGWGGAIGAFPLFELLPSGGIAWLVAGGVGYTVGAVFFLWNSLPFNHLIWHLAVMLGASCHFVSIIGYVAPLT